MQFGLKLSHRLRLALVVDDDHASTDVLTHQLVVSLNSLNTKTSKVTSHSLLRDLTGYMDGFYGDQLEVAHFVRAQQVVVVQTCDSTSHNARKNEANALNYKALVDLKLEGLETEGLDGRRRDMELRDKLNKHREAVLGYARDREDGAYGASGHGLYGLF